LHKNSIVFDVGGYKGHFAHEIYGRYGCTIFVFEPIAEYATYLRKRFRGKKKIKIFNFGLGDRDKRIRLYLRDDRTSQYKKYGQYEDAKIMRIGRFLQQYRIKEIDLIGINIEGGEYDLLEYLIKSGIVKRINNIQVQFHPVVENAEKRMNKIQKALYKTHEPTYQYPFVWENWRRRKGIK
jgi:FkbM family methyltransferase